MKKAIGLACLLGIAGTSGSLAADIRDAAPVPGPQPGAPLLSSWAGPYIGAQAGYLAAGSDIAGPGSGEFHLFDLKGFTGGVMAGYGKQWGRVVGGLEGDINFVGTTTTIDTGFAPDPTVTQSQTRMIWNGHLRGRLGYANGRAMIFAAGGLALARVENKAIDNRVGATATWNDVRVGWTLGGGIDYRVAPATTFRFEYLYDNYGSRTLAAQNVDAVSFAERVHKLDAHTLRAGVSWRF